MYRSVVAVGAHPDDVEGGCGGTLIKLADAGCRVVLAYSNGEASVELPFADDWRVRPEEQLATDLCRQPRVRAATYVYG